MSRGVGVGVGGNYAWKYTSTTWAYTPLTDLLRAADNFCQRQCVDKSFLLPNNSKIQNEDS